MLNDNNPGRHVQSVGGFCSDFWIASMAGSCFSCCIRVFSGSLWQRKKNLKAIKVSGLIKNIHCVIVLCNDHEVIMRSCTCFLLVSLQNAASV